MFLRIKVLVENEEISVPINVTHIISIEAVNPRNQESGSYIYTRDGRYFETVLPVYEVGLMVDEVTERYAGVIMVSFLGEYMELKEEKPKRTYKKKA